MRLSDHKTIYLLIFFLFCSYFLQEGLRAQFVDQHSTYKIRNYNKVEYKAENQNWSITCGHNGFVYVANNGGLLVYDGASWEFYNSPNIENIRSVKVEEETGRIYTSGYREMGYWEWDSLGFLNYQSLRYLAEDQFAKNEEFWNIEIANGNVIFQAFSGLFIYNGIDFKIIKPNFFVNTFSLVNNEILPLALNRGIYKLVDDSITPYVVEKTLNQKSIRFVLEIGTDSLLIGTANNGLFLSDGNNVIPVYEEYFEYFQTNTINRGTLIIGEIIVIGTLLDGIIGISIKTGKTIFKINEENGLQNNTVLGFAVQENNLWVSLDKGISFIDFTTNPAYEMHEIKEVGAVYSAALYNKKIYLGTNQGLYSRGINEDDEKFALVPGTQSQVWDCKVVDDQLFIGHNSGTFVIDDENNVSRISNVSGGFCLTDNPYEVNSLIQSTYSSLAYYRKENNRWVLSHTISNFFDLIRYVEIDHLNNIWAGHMRRAIFKIQLNDQQDSAQKVTYYGKNSVFDKEYGINVFKVENRIVFTTGDILYTYDDINDSIVPYTQVNDVLGEFSKAHRIVKSENHHYWFITSNSAGLFNFEIDRITLVKEFPFALFNYKFIEGYENIVPLSEKKAILCLENGYAILNAGTISEPSRELQNIKLRPKKITISGKTMLEDRLPINSDNFEIPFSKNNLKVQYSFPYFSARDINYLYFIEGLDETWSEPLEIPEFEFNRIPAGEYAIRVIAENEWGERSTAHELHIKVLLPWYVSTVAIICYIILLGAIVLLVRYVSVKRIKEKEKIKREHKEQELIKLRNQNLRSELSFKSQELANTTMSIIKKNEFLLKLKDALQKQKEDLGTRYPDKYYNHVVKKIDNNISHGDDWKIFETNVEQAHELFIQKLLTKYPQLTHSDLRLCTYLRMNLSSKEIAPLMRISVRGVENHRYRIRKKLDLPSDINLTDFILGFKV